MEFLYSLNRLNVATSRGQAVVIVVGSPRLFEPDTIVHGKCNWRIRFAGMLKWLKLSSGHHNAQSAGASYN